jgi:hypothetical protein
MYNWKKLGALAALALPMSILGAACTAEVAEPEEGTDTVSSADVITAENGGIAPESPNATELDHRDIDRAPEGFCERRCAIEYKNCLRGFGHGYGHDRDFGHGDFGRRRSCQYRYSRCISYCYYQPYPH